MGVGVSCEQGTPVSQCPRLLLSQSLCAQNRGASGLFDLQAVASAMRCEIAVQLGSIIFGFSTGSNNGLNHFNEPDPLWL